MVLPMITALRIVTASSTIIGRPYPGQSRAQKRIRQGGTLQPCVQRNDCLRRQEPRLGLKPYTVSHLSVAISNSSEKFRSKTQSEVSIRPIARNMKVTRWFQHETVIIGDSMSEESAPTRRRDTQTAEKVQCGVSMQRIAGPIEARRYLTNCGLSIDIIDRVLGRLPLRRNLCDPAFPDSRPPPG